MAANLKIGIIADDSGAQKKFEGLSTSVDMTAKSVTALANQFANLNAQKVNILNKTDKYVEDIEKLSATTKNMHTVFNQLMNAIERQKISWGASKDSVSTLKKELSELEKVETLLVSKGVGSSFSGDLAGLEPLVQKYNEYKKELKEVIKLKEQEEIASAKALSPSSVSSSVSSSTSYKKAGLLGDSVSQMKQEYEAYSESLTKIINTLGDGSPEAKKMAEAMGELGKRIEKTGTQTTATSGRIKNLVKNFVSAQLIVWALRKAFTTITNTLKESAEAASKAEETYNLFITTFENVATTAESVATRLSSSMGMANSTAQKALGTFGDLATGYGATDKAALEFGETATKVALDIISYKNISGDLDTTFQSIASGLAGNVENFRKLGYVMTQAEVKTRLQKKGLDKLTGSALQYAQIQARLEILQEKSVKAQGDMIKTLDSTENVTRRLSEAWLEYKENLGQHVNKVFTPIKKWWLDILAATNKAIAAKEKFLETGSNGDVFNASSNNDDYNAFIKALKSATRGVWSGGSEETSITGLNSKDETEYKKAMENLKTIVGIYGGTAEQVKTWLSSNSKYSDDLINKIYNEIKTWKAEQDKVEKDKLEKETLKNERLNRISSILNLMDSLSNYAKNIPSIDAITYTQTAVQRGANNISETKKGKVIAVTPVEEYLDKATKNWIDTLLASFAETDAMEFVSALDVALGNSDIDKALEEKLAAAKSIYEELWNDIISGGEATAEQLETALKNVSAIQKKIKSRETWGKAWDEGMEELKEIFSFTVSSLRTTFEVPFMGVMRAFEGGIAKAGEAKANGGGFFKQTGAFLSGAGEGVWEYLKDIFNDLIEPIARFVTESEAFQELMTVLSESVMPAINAVLEPFLPILKMVGKLLQDVVLPILYELFPIIKAIAVVCGYVIAAVGTAISFISNGVKWVVGNVIGWIQDMVNTIRGWFGWGGVNWGFDGWRNIDVLGESKKVWDSMLENVEEIKSCSMEIEKNTSKDMDLSILNDMASMGLLSSDEVASLRASYLGLSSPERQTQLIRTEAGNYATNLRSGSTQNVSYGDMSIVVNSESGDPEAIAKEVARILEEWKRSGKSNFQTAIA